MWETNFRDRLYIEFHYLYKINSTNMNLFEQSVIRDTSKLQYLIEPYLTFI